MKKRTVLFVQFFIFVFVAFPFTRIHLATKSDDAPISPHQHAVAASANLLGPWAGPIVHLVDFPNAGLRSFSLVKAIAFSAVAVLLVMGPFLLRRRALQYMSLAFYAVFLVVWFGVGFFQIADGLL